MRGGVRFLSRLREHKVLRYISLSLTIAAVVLAAVMVSTLTVDLGPLVRGRAEQAASRRLKRAVRIGSLHVQVFTGRLLLGDLSIDGRRPEDRPFFTAKRLSVSLDWSTALRRRPEFTVTSVELTDWQMLVEEWPDGHNFPKFTSDDTASGSAGPRRFTATLRYLRASRGQFTYQNHGDRWGVVAPNLDLSITKARGYQGEATFSGGTLTIMDNLPMWANVKASFGIDGSRIHVNRFDIDSDGARSVAEGDIDLTRWPEMLYEVRSRVNFPRMREIFFRDQVWELAGDGDFTGTFHLFKGGHDLSGAFTSNELGVYAYRFPSLYGSLHWTRKLFDVTSAGSDLYGGASRFAFSIKPLGSPEHPTARFDASYQDVDLVQVSDFYELAGLRFVGSASGRNVLEWPLGDFTRRRDEGRIEVTMPPGVRPAGGASSGGRTVPSDDEGSPPRSVPPTAITRSRMGTLRAAAAPLAPPDRRRADVPLRRRARGAGPEPLRDRADRCHVPGPDRLGRAVAVCVPRDEPRLSGERSDPGRDPHRLRIADRRGRVRRPR